MRKYVVYYRVSTREQGISGLGLDSQRSSIERFIESENINKEVCLFCEYTDIETAKGAKTKRPGLNNAIDLCRNLLNKGEDVILLIAKIDRLSRNLSFISNLMESGIKFVACDMPNANNFTIHILASVAQQEAEMISLRTKEALSEFKKRNPDGFIDAKGKFRKGLGNPDGFKIEHSIQGGIAVKEKYENDEDTIRARNYAKSLRDNGMSLSAIAKKLNRDGFKTINGLNFSSMQICRFMRYFENKNVVL